MSEAQKITPPPVELTPDIAAIVNSAGARGVPVAVAYVDDSGAPQLSPRGTVHVHSTDELAFWARSPRLPRALRTNPNVSLIYQDLANGTLFQFNGRARVETDDATRTAIFDRTSESEQAHDLERNGAAIVVAVDSVKGKGASGFVQMIRPVEPARSPLAAAVGRQGTVMAQMLIVDDVDRSVRFYRDVLGATVLREHSPAMLRFHNGWLILNVGGGPTADKPDVTVAPPADLNRVSAFLNIRVADIDAVYRDWSARGATFITEPIDNHGVERRCYLRDPDGYLIEVGQTARAS